MISPLYSILGSIKNFYAENNLKRITIIGILVKLLAIIGVIISVVIPQFANVKRIKCLKRSAGYFIFCEQGAGDSFFLNSSGTGTLSVRHSYKFKGKIFRRCDG